MTMNYEDRYYEPEEVENFTCAEYDEIIDDWVRYEMREGGNCYPFSQINFGEYLCETGQEDKAIEDATMQDREGSIEYWTNIATMFAEEAWEDR